MCNIKAETFSVYSGSGGNDGPIEEDQDRILFVERFLNASVKLLLESDDSEFVKKQCKKAPIVSMQI